MKKIDNHCLKTDVDFIQKNIIFYLFFRKFNGKLIKYDKFK